MVRRARRAAGQERPGHARGDRERQASARVRRRRRPPLTADQVPAMLVAKARPPAANVAVAPRFQVGQRVRARNINPAGHTRLPRYARGKARRRSIATMASSSFPTPTPIFSARSRSMSTRCASPRANCGASRLRRAIPSMSICGMTTLSQPDPTRSERLAALPRLPRDEAARCSPSRGRRRRSRSRCSSPSRSFHLEGMGGRARRRTQGRRRSRRARRRLALLSPLAGGARAPGHGQGPDRPGALCSRAKKPGPTPTGTRRTASRSSWLPLTPAKSQHRLQSVGFQLNLASV